MDEVTTIENTKEAKDNYGHLYGSKTFELSDSNIQDLMLGKIIALNINDEYVAFVRLED